MYLLIFFIIFSSWDEYRAVKQLYNEGKFIDAKSGFEKLLQKYPRADILPYCMFYIANLSRDSEEAIEYYKILVDSYPTSTVADNALARLGSYYYIMGEYSRADSMYYRIISDYPEGDCAQVARKWRDRIKNFNGALFFTIQVGAFKQLKNAEELTLNYPNVAMDIVFDGTFYKVLLGRFTTREDAERFKDKHKIEGFIVKTSEREE